MLGDQTVPIAAWLKNVVEHVEGENIAAICADRYRRAEVGEGLDAAGIHCPIIWRGFGFKDGGEDCERFRRAAYDGNVLTAPSLLLRSAFSDAICLRDPANNIKLAKARSKGRIDPVSATVLAVAEGARMVARPASKAGRLVWG